MHYTLCCTLSQNVEQLCWLTVAKTTLIFDCRLSKCTLLLQGALVVELYWYKIIDIIPSVLIVALRYILDIVKVGWQ